MSVIIRSYDQLNTYEVSKLNIMWYDSAYRSHREFSNTLKV